MATPEPAAATSEVRIRAPRSKEARHPLRRQQTEAKKKRRRDAAVSRAKNRKRRR